MPRNPIAAKRYVRALGFQPNDVATIQASLQELRSFLAVLASTKEIRGFFLSPVVSKAEKLAMLSEVKEKFPTTLRFLAALIDANRLAIMPEIVEELEASMEAISGEMSVTIESARALSEESLGDIKAILQDKWGRKIKAKVLINPDLIGGFVAKAPGKILDASVRRQFEVLKQALGA